MLILIFGRLTNVIKLRELCAELEMSEGLEGSASGKQMYKRVLVLVKLCVSMKKGGLGV